MNEKLNSSIDLSEKEIMDFAARLEKAGYSGALELVKDSLVPLAKKRNIPLMDAALEYSNQDSEQDTSYYQLFEALQKLS